MAGVDPYATQGDLVPEIPAELRGAGFDDRVEVLISALIDAEEDGERLEFNELVQMRHMIIAAGSETTTFFLTNVVPQSPNSNQRGWEKLEAYCRDLVLKEGHTLYIVCGGYGVGGEGKNGRAETIGKGRIGEAPFVELLAHPATAGIPVIVETPSVEHAGHAADIALLKSLRPA